MGVNLEYVDCLDMFSTLLCLFSFFRPRFLMQIEYSDIGEILVTLYHKREEPSLPKMMIVHGGRAVMIFVAAPRQAKQASLEPTICYCHRI